MAAASEVTPLVAEKRDSSSSKRPILSWLAPEGNPAAWVIVNFFFFVWSLILVFDILLSIGPLDRRYGKQIYLVWNFASTLVWCLEIVLSAWYAGGTQAPSVSVILQVLIAVYFLCDSVLMFRKWMSPDTDVDAELFDTIISTIAYLYGLVIVLFQYFAEPVPVAVVEENPPTVVPDEEVHVETPPVQEEEQVSPSKRRNRHPPKAKTEIQKRFPQFFAVKEGWEGWGRESTVIKKGLKAEDLWESK